MIGVSLATAVFIYFAIWILLVLVLWVRETLRQRRNQYNLNKNSLFNCDNCHYAFLSKEEDAHLTRCPRCNAICIKRKRRDF